MTIKGVNYGGRQEVEKASVTTQRSKRSFLSHTVQWACNGSLKELKLKGDSGKVTGGQHENSGLLSFILRASVTRGGASYTLCYFVRWSFVMNWVKRWAHTAWLGSSVGQERQERPTASALAWTKVLFVCYNLQVLEWYHSFPRLRLSNLQFAKGDGGLKKRMMFSPGTSCSACLWPAFFTCKLKTIVPCSKHFFFGGGLANCAHKVHRILLPESASSIHSYSCCWHTHEVRLCQ